MANQKSINQGDINDNSIKPTWGTFERQEEYDKEDRFIAIVESISKTVANKADINHDHDDRYYTEPEIDADVNELSAELNEKVAKSGDTMTGSLTVIGEYFQKSEEPDATKADNGLSATVGYSLNRLDKNGLPITYFDGYIRADGSIASAFGAINYDTSGARVAASGMMINIQKNGTGAWTVSEPTSFRNAIGASNGLWGINVGGTGASNIVDARKNLGYVGMFCAQAVFGAECIDIPANANLNSLTYTATGKYYVPLNATVGTLTNCPTGSAFQMMVYNLLSDATGQATGIAWTYRTRILITYTGDIFIQSISTNGSGVASYSVWKKVTMA